MKTIISLLFLLYGSSLIAVGKPNIIFIMADDLGFADISCYGSKTVKTPHIDALAGSGMRCTDFHSNGPVCSPTRAAFFTGRYQQHSGITGVVTAAKHRDKGLALDEWTIGEAMKEQGYQTALFGKWHLGYKPGLNPVHQGFDQYNGFVSGNVDYHNHIDLVGIQDWYQQDELKDEKGYVTDLITDHTIRFIEKNKDKPFFIVVAHGAPHAPYQGRGTPAFRKLGKGGQNQGTTAEDDKKAFIEMIEVMDEGIGKIVAKLDETGLRENTLIVFCSDNGPAKKGDAGILRGGKGSLYEGGHRVCGVINWKGAIAPGQVCDTPMMTIDMLPTFVSLSGGSIPTERKIEGRDISGIFKGETFEREPLFWQYKSVTAVRKGPWKMMSFAKGRKVELYNLADDLGEKKNLAKQYPELVQQLSDEIDRWDRKVNKK